MSTALLSMYDFVDYRNSSTAPVTVATGVSEKSSSAAAVSAAQKALFQQQQFSTIASTQQQQQHMKMTGGIRRTVSSAATPSAAQLMSSQRLSSVQQSSPITGNKSSSLISSSNTQSATSVRTSTAAISGLKDPHKKLDRSFSEPAEKKGSAAANAAVQAAANAAAAAAASTLGPSSRYKTELCRSFAEVGSCKYGDKCQFAHGEEELRTITRHPKFKTENCKSFHSTGFCPYGPRCHFIHNNGDEPKKQSSTSATSATTNAPAAVPSSPSAVVGAGAHIQRATSLFEPVIGGGIHQQQSFAANPSPIGHHHHHSQAAQSHQELLRPKARSLGSYSLGSSGEISLPSSQSGSPTSLNSFFTEDSFATTLSSAFGLGGSNNAASSRLVAPVSASAAFPPSSASSHAHHNHGTFSFSPDSAFVSFSNSSSGCGSSFSGSQKALFGGSQPTLSSASRFSPEPMMNGGRMGVQDSGESAASSVFHSLFDQLGDGHHHQGGCSQFSDLYRAMSPLQKVPTGANYPLAPESPVDSVASEIEALKLGEMLPNHLTNNSSHQSAGGNAPMHHHSHQLASMGFAPISPISFSSTTSSSLSSAHSPSVPTAAGLLSELEALASSFNAAGGNNASSTNGTANGQSNHIPRLPTFTRFASTIESMVSSAYE